MGFLKYQHIERWGTTEVEGIEVGKCWIFPKLDGTNSSVWWDGEAVRFGSRNRVLSLDEDNQGFMEWALKDAGVMNAVPNYPNWQLYGEWLVPHTLRTYRNDAWREFYVFDVRDRDTDRYIPFDEYDGALRTLGTEVLQPLCTITNPTAENILHEVERNTYLIQDGKGIGEGVVVKNYGWQNRYGRQTWAKMVRNEFKELHVKAMGICEKTGTSIIEAGLAEIFCTPEFVAKTRAKIEADGDTSRSSLIPRLLQTVFYDLVREETWEMLKTLKGERVIDFRRLQQHVILRTKMSAADLF